MCSYAPKLSVDKYDVISFYLAHQNLIVCIKPQLERPNAGRQARLEAEAKRKL
jgi:hypothetical protein